MTDFLTECRRRKLLAGSGGRLPQERFWIFNSLTSLSWVSESFRRDIGQILTWKVFFISKNIFITKNLTDLRKTVEPGVIRAWIQRDSELVWILEDRELLVNMSSKV